MKTPNIAAIVHIYYPEFWPELAGCLRNIKEPFDLFVTVRSDAGGDAICGKIIEDFPFAHITRPENVGYDIWPFLSVINAIDLSPYDIVIKLHTKRDMLMAAPLNGFDMSGAKWRQNLLRFISTDKAWVATKRQFTNPKTGAVASLSTILSYSTTPEPGRISCRRALLLAHRIFHKRLSRRYKYVGGTMFAIRASLLKPLQGIFYSKDFARSGEVRTEDLAHEIERLFGACVSAAGMRIVPYRGNLVVHGIWFFLKRHVLKFFYQRKIKKNGDVIYRILRIPVWRTYVTQT